MLFYQKIHSVDFHRRLVPAESVYWLRTRVCGWVGGCAFLLLCRLCCTCSWFVSIAVCLFLFFLFVCLLRTVPLGLSEVVRRLFFFRV